MNFSFIMGIVNPTFRYFFLASVQHVCLVGTNVILVAVDASANEHQHDREKEESVKQSEGHSQGYDGEKVLKDVRLGGHEQDESEKCYSTI